MSTIYEQTLAWLKKVEEGDEISPSRARWVAAFIRLQHRQIELMEQLSQTNPDIQVIVIAKELLYDESGIDLDLSHLGKLSWEKDILDIPRHSIEHWECRGKGCNDCNNGIIFLTENQARLMLRAIEEETDTLMNLMYNWTQFQGRMDRIRECVSTIHNINRYGVISDERNDE